MVYTEEEIAQYTKILKSYTGGVSPPQNPPTNQQGSYQQGGYGGMQSPRVCKNCQSSSSNFTIYLGQYICEECGVFNGHVLGYFDIREQDRLFYKKKSIYNRKYHYEKKVNQISKRLNLTDNEKDQLYSKLMIIDNDVTKSLNKQFDRKRLINIFYLIKKVLQEMNCEKYKLVDLKISPQTFENYEKWWRSYKNIK